MNKKKKIANLHTNMAILTNIKLDYSSAGLAKVASTLLPPECVVYCQKEMGVIVVDCSLTCQQNKVTKDLICICKPHVVV